MAIRITDDKNVEVVEPLEFRFKFMDEMKIRQSRINNDAEMPYYDVIITWRLYAIDSNGDYHYKNKTDTIRVDNFVEYAMTLLNDEGDASLLQAMQVIQGVVATMIARQTGESLEIV